MDLMAQRYSSPFLILDNFIKLEQLHDFTAEIIKKISDEKVEQIRWDYYLHKVWNMEYAEYINSCKNRVQNTAGKTMKRETAIDIINASTDILNSFGREGEYGE